EDQQQRQSRQPLLTIDDELLAFLVADDDGAEEVVPVLGHCAAVVAGLMAFQKLARQILDQLRELLVPPAVLALIVVDGVLLSRQDLGDGTALAIDVVAGRRSAHSISPTKSFPKSLGFSAFFAAFPLPLAFLPWSFSSSAR